MHLQQFSREWQKLTAYMFCQPFLVRTLELFEHLKLDMLTSAQLSRKCLPCRANDSLRPWTAQFWLHLLLQPFAVILSPILNQWVLVLTSFEAVCFRSRTAELTISAIDLPSSVKKDIFSSSPRSWKKKKRIICIFSSFYREEGNCKRAYSKPLGFKKEPSLLNHNLWLCKPFAQRTMLKLRGQIPTAMCGQIDRGAFGKTESGKWPKLSLDEDPVTRCLWQGSPFASSIALAKLRYPWKTLQKRSPFVKKMQSGPRDEQIQSSEFLKEHLFWKSIFSLSLSLFLFSEDLVRIGCRS